MDIHSLSGKVIGCAYKVHNHFGYGFLEKVYENALTIELGLLNGISVKQQFPIPVFFTNERSAIISPICL